MLLYAISFVPFGSEDGIKVSTGHELVQMIYSFEPVQLNVSVAVTVNVSHSDAVGDPEIFPVAVSRDKPAGSEPAERENVYGDVPPLADTVWLYATAI